MKNGIISIHKPAGISSARVVSRVKRALNVKKVGHTGTLDPFATGLVLCAINKGTKISRFFLGGHKKYTARIHLGVETDTCDLTGEVVETCSKDILDAITEDQVKDVVASFKGEQDQFPPAFSALKHEGQPLYKLARQGIKIQKPARRITIFDIKIIKMDLPDVDIEVSCSSGTYIRTIASDIGKKLSCGAHLSKLCRTASSAFNLGDAITLEDLEKLDPEAIEKRIIGMYDSLYFMPEIHADNNIARRIKFGQKIYKDDFKDPDLRNSDLKNQDLKDSDPKNQDNVDDAFFKVVDEQKEVLAIVQLSDTSEYNYTCVFVS